MGKYILKRTGMMVLILFLIVSIAFFVLRLMPGSPYDDDQDLSPEAILCNFSITNLLMLFSSHQSGVDESYLTMERMRS